MGMVRRLLQSKQVFVYQSVILEGAAMKLPTFPLVLLAILLLGSVPAYAGLINLGNGIIYDTDLKLSWLQNANLAATNTFGVSGITAEGRMSWYTAQSWIAAMNGANYLGFSDWRLPTALNQDGSGPCSVYNCNGSEMGYLYYVILGGSAHGPGGIATTHNANYDYFVNIQNVNYWSGTESDPVNAWGFGFGDGGQGPVGGKVSVGFAWAVRDGGGTTVPETGSTLLFLGMAFVPIALSYRWWQR
jgi:hypothetical protein